MATGATTASTDAPAPTPVASSFSKSYLPKRAYLPCARYAFIASFIRKRQRHDFCPFLQMSKVLAQGEGRSECKLGRWLRIAKDERRRRGKPRDEIGRAHV